MLDFGEVPFVETAYQKHDRLHNDKRRAQWRKAKESRSLARREAWLNKRFVAWDGEGSSVPDGMPQPYILFGNSDNSYIQAPDLSSESCLELVSSGDPDAINVSFAFGYDSNQILKDLPVGKLWSIGKFGRQIVWKGNVIEWVDHKWFSVRKNIKGARRIQIFDCFHFFNCSLVAALEKYEIGSPEERAFIAEQKANRPFFTWEEIEEVKTYWKLENKLFVELMDYIRSLFGQAGYYLTSWHGPGAVARELMKSHNVKAAQSDIRSQNIEVWIAARYAFSGGRFEQFQAGLYEGPVWNYDIHSAYPYAIQFLPDLNSGKWIRIPFVDRRQIDPKAFALYHIRYNDERRTDQSNKEKARPRPLFRRLKNDNIFWPAKVEGWYWSPEAYLVANDEAAEFVEGWIFEPSQSGEGLRPVAWIQDTYNTRERHKRLGNPIEYPFKLGMNSCYGQFAQRAGWQRYKGPPPYHQLEWAGYVTSMCKYMVHVAAKYAYENNGLITIDTDGVFSSVPIPREYLINGVGEDLGQWEEVKYDGILIWQNGFYWLKSGNDWKKCRTRGAPRGYVDISAAWKSLPTLDTIHYPKKIYTGFRYAANTSFERWRSWQTIDCAVQFGGTGKRQHAPRWCEKCIGNDVRFPGEGDSNRQLHNLHPMPIAYSEYTGRYVSNWSYMHHLPWLDAEKMAVEPEPEWNPELDEIWEAGSL